MKKKDSIRLIFILGAFVVGILLIRFDCRPKTHIEKGKHGRAIFHSFDFEIVDSIINLATPNQLLQKIFILSDPTLAYFESSIIDTLTRYSSSFFVEKEGAVPSSIFRINQSLGSKSLLIRGISQSGSSSFAGDSVFIPTREQLNSFTCNSLFVEYSDYHNSFISSLGFNGKIIDFILPDFHENWVYRRVSQRLEAEITNLHKDHLLSILDLRNRNTSNDSLVAARQRVLLVNLIETGLCGVIIDNQKNLELFDYLRFDGLVIFDSRGQGKLPQQAIEFADVFLIPDGGRGKEIHKNIAEQLKVKPRRSKAFKVLRAALWAQKSRKPAFLSNHKIEDLLRSKIAKSSIILLKNYDSTIPISNLNQKFLVVNTTNENTFHFKKKLFRYTNNFTYLEHPLGDNKPLIIPEGTDHIIVISDHKIRNLRKSEIVSLQNHKSTIFVHGGEDISIPLMTGMAVLQIHSINDHSLSYSAQLLFGGIAAKGILSKNHNDTLKFGFGLNTKKTRLEFTLPENAGLCSQRLQKIDSIIINAIASRAFPGAQVLVAKNGKVVYNKTFGHHDYTRARQVRDHDLYDVASITKIAASTLAAMKLYEQNKINLNYETGRYFKDTSIDFGSVKADTLIFVDTLNIARISTKELVELINKRDTLHINDTIITAKETVVLKATPSLNIFKIPIRRLLVHQSGLSPSLPILPFIKYEQTFEEQRAILTKTDASEQVKALISTNPFNYFFSNKRITDTADVMVAENMYLRNHFSDSIYYKVKKLGVHPNPRLQYACMNMILLQMIMDSINKTSLDIYLKTNFYHPLGMQRSTFNPLRFVGKDQIVPTEDDTSWRKRLVHGTVHDPSAAILGGIAGNAGLFSTASDLAILGQMLLNGGNYGGRKYLDSQTIKTFTARQPENHKGLGFDKPSDKGIHADSVPKSAYGHLGFTGCAMWIDPENEIMFIFLSNRIHPSVSNQRINTERIRQKVHQVVYDSFLSKK